MNHCNTKSRALKVAKICIIQVVCSGGDKLKDDQEDVAYDLRLFEDLNTCSINLEPVIHRMLGMVLLKCKTLKAETHNAFEEEPDEEMEEEKGAEIPQDLSPFDLERIQSMPYKERVEAAVYA